MLHNKIFMIGDKKPVHINLPENYDIVFLPMPDVTNYEETGFTLTYKGMIVDYGTGTYADFLLSPKPVAKYDSAVQTHKREHYNELLEFIFLVEGRYLSFWTSSLLEQFVPVGYAPGMFPQMTGLDHIGGESPELASSMFVLNWGQLEEWTSSNKLILMFTEGYTKCYWCKPKNIRRTTDFRILEVIFEDPLPNIPIDDIDLITDAIYVRMGADETKFEALTSTIYDCFFELLEDPTNYYNPWVEKPKVYPAEASAALDPEEGAY